MTPPQNLNELAEKCAKDIDKYLWEHHHFMSSGTLSEFRIKLLSALTEATTPLLEKIAELEKDNETAADMLRFSSSLAIDTAKQLSTLEAQNNQYAHDLKQIREALGCAGSDLPQLLDAIDQMKAQNKSLREALEKYSIAHGGYEKGGRYWTLEDAEAKRQEALHPPSQPDNKCQQHSMYDPTCPACQWGTKPSVNQDTGAAKLENPPHFPV